MELNLHLMIPELFLLASSLLFILLDLIVPDRSKNGLFSVLSLGVLVVTAA